MEAMDFTIFNNFQPVIRQIFELRISPGFFLPVSVFFFKYQTLLTLRKDIIPLFLSLFQQYVHQN
ncbi:MAG TPA: hypothetical protein DCP64_01645 [Sarcina sp.]|nr:hypothetical protein [Sarcina sp.]